MAGTPEFRPYRRLFWAAFKRGWFNAQMAATTRGDEWFHTTTFGCTPEWYNIIRIKHVCISVLLCFAQPQRNVQYRGETHLSTHTPTTTTTHQGVLRLVCMCAVMVVLMVLKKPRRRGELTAKCRFRVQSVERFQTDRLCICGNSAAPASRVHISTS